MPALTQTEVAFRAALQQRGAAAPAGSRLEPPRVLIHFGEAPGDDLLCSTLAHELVRRRERPVWMMSRHAELFAANVDFDRVVPVDAHLAEAVQDVGGRFVVPVYTRHDWAHDRGDRPVPTEHILSIMCRIAGLSGEVPLRPYFSLRPDEMNFGQFVDRQVAIHTGGAGATFPMANKDWPAARFQAVVDALRGQCTFVQLGTVRDHPLAGAIDLRGKTTIRQAAAVLRQSQLLVGLVGFLMHLNRAVDRRAVIVYGGRELPWQSGYVCNENLVGRPPCSPCWQWNRCDFDRACLSQIQVDSVVDAVRRQLGRRNEPLEVEMSDLRVESSFRWA